MPCLEHLTIESHSGQELTKGFFPHTAQDGIVLPHGIKTITFKKCAHLGYDYVSGVASAILSRENSTFEKLLLVECPISHALWTHLTIILRDRFFCTASFIGSEIG